MLFSIILPTYNSLLTIKDCLRSIICQTFTDIEIIIIDNKSSDTTLSIVQSFTDFRIKICSEKDKGIYDAMNKGIELAKGEFLYFMGSDDTLYDKDTLARLYNVIIENKNTDIFYGNVIYKELHRASYGHHHFSRYKLRDENLNHQSIIYKKTVFEKIGKYNLKYPVLADWEFNIRCFYSNKFSISYIDQIIAYYSTTGISNQRKDDFIYDKDPLILSYIKKEKLIHRIDYHLYILKEGGKKDTLKFKILSISRCLYLFFGKYYYKIKG